MPGFSRSHRLADLSSAEFAAITAANPVILLPLGSHEDHGRYLPMGDFATAEILAGRIAQAAAALGVPAYAAPALAFGVADYFGSSTGGMAISAASFRGVLSELISGLLRHGLTRIIILNGHGGNAPVIHEVTLAIRLSQNVVIPSFYLWKIARSLMERRLGPGHEGRFGHGGEPLASLSMALRPGHSPQGGQSADEAGTELGSSMLGLPVSGFGMVAFEGFQIDVPAEFREVSSAAIEAAQLQRSADLGDEIAAELVGLAARFAVHYAGNGGSDQSA